MCVRTKTSYDCGHSFKDHQDCERKVCHGRERYHFENEGDCRRCREGGEAITRGRDGQGRYAREMSRKEARSSAPRTPLSIVTDNYDDSPASPWAPPSRREKDWRSPIRKKADQGWEDEHSRREEDLQSRTVGSKASSGDSLPSYRDDLSTPLSPSPPLPSRRPRRRDEREAAIREELRKADDMEQIRSRRRRERQPSYDSFESLGGSHRSQHAYDQQYSQGYSQSHSQSQSHSYSPGHTSRSQFPDDDHYMPSSTSRTAAPSSHRSRMYDSGFGSRSKYENPYNVYNTEHYLSGLGHEFGELVRDSGRRWARR